MQKKKPDFIYVARLDRKDGEIEGQKENEIKNTLSLANR